MKNHVRGRVWSSFMMKNKLCGISAPRKQTKRDCRAAYPARYWLRPQGPRGPKRHMLEGSNSIWEWQLRRYLRRDGWWSKSLPENHPVVGTYISGMAAWAGKGICQGENYWLFLKKIVLFLIKLKININICIQIPCSNLQLMGFSKVVERKEIIKQRNLRICTFF